jgi:hypothetical protein
MMFLDGYCDSGDSTIQDVVPSAKFTPGDVKMAMIPSSADGACETGFHTNEAAL